MASLWNTASRLLRSTRRALALAAPLGLAACAGTQDTGPGEVGPPEGLQCVPYARQVSGIDIRGDAWTWWYAAAGRYERGAVPEPGAVLVMEATPTMRLGHVAVVESVISAREITITQANWGNTPETRGRIETGTPVLDVSPDNSWQAVQVWYRPAQAYGRVNPTFGFIYPRPLRVAARSAGADAQLAQCPRPAIGAELQTQ